MQRNKVKHSSPVDDFKPVTFRTPKLNTYIYWFELLIGGGYGLSALQHYWNKNISGAVVDAFYCMLFFGLARFVVKPLATGTIELHADGIIVGNRPKILFSSVTKITFSRTAFWFKLHLKDKKSARITFHYLRGHQLLDSILELNPTLTVDPVLAKRFRKKTMLSYLSHGLLRTVWPAILVRTYVWPGITYVAAYKIVVATGYLMDRVSMFKGAVPWFVAFCSINAAIEILCAVLHMRRVGKLLEQDSIDMKAIRRCQSRLRRMTFWLYYVTTTLLGSVGLGLYLWTRPL
jgi:hypothetical protein